MIQFLRNSLHYFWKNKTLSLLNLIGLSVGITASLFSFFYVDFELSYDRYNENVESIYRVVTDIKSGSGTTFESTSAPIAPTAEAQFPEVKESVRVFLDYMIVQLDGQTFEEHFAYVDPSIFDVFTLPMISGNPKTALDEPFKLVLSESGALKYFGTVDCIGRTLLIDSDQPATVSGVIKDMPSNSHFRVDMFLSLSTLLDHWNPSTKTNWNRYGFYTYLLTEGSVDPQKISSVLSNLVTERSNQPDSKYLVSIEPLPEVYLNGKSRGSRYGSSSVGDINSLYIFITISAFVLFIAFFNFINLTTAFASFRAKETSIRKVLGASKKQLVVQYIMDAMVLTIVAFGVALLFCYLLFPLFNQLVGKVVVGSLLDYFDSILLMFLATIMIGFITGIYPALLLANSNSIAILKGEKTLVSGGARLRKLLVVLQFAISILLIIATSTIYSQLKYMQNTDVGFKKDQMIIADFYFDERVSKHAESLKDQIKSLANVNEVSISSAVPTRLNRKLQTSITNQQGQDQTYFSDVYFVDNDFLDMYKIQLIAGRKFSKGNQVDIENSMLLNQSAVANLGFKNPEEALGKRFKQRGAEGEIIGVVKDFNFQSLRDGVSPLSIRQGGNLNTFISIDLNSAENLSSTVNKIETIWKRNIPDRSFNYFFSDDAYAARYDSESRFGKLFSIFALLAILISCLGIFGLSTFTAVRRTKEIGIRKVLGSTSGGVVLLLTREYFSLIALSFVVGGLFGWYMSTSWLENFAFRIDLSWWIFAGSGVAAFLITFITTGIYTLKAANSNPVDTLKSD